MMKLLICITTLVGLLGVGMAGAEVTKPQLGENTAKTWKDIGKPSNEFLDDVLQRCVDGKCLPVARCLDKMEATMKALDKVVQSASRDYVGSHYGMREHPSTRDRQRWEEAKRECWKDS